MRLCTFCEELFEHVEGEHEHVCRECYLDNQPDNDEFQGWDYDVEVREYTEADAQHQLDNMPAEDYPWADEDLPF